MRLLHRVIKQQSLINSGEVFMVPDEESASEQELSEAQEDDTSDAVVLEAQMEAQSSYEAMREQKQIEQADDISHKILQSARTEREKILEQAHQEAMEIRQDAWNTGYQEAISEKREEMAACIAHAEELMTQLQHEHQDFLRQYESGLNELAIDIAEKVLKGAIHENSDLMAALVKEAVASVRNANWISIQVSENLPGLVDTLKRELSDVQNLRHAVEVSADDLPEDACIIQTPEGVLDASIGVQMDNLRAVLGKSDL